MNRERPVTISARRPVNRPMPNDGTVKLTDTARGSVPSPTGTPLLSECKGRL